MTMNRHLVILGCGGHGRSSAALAERAGYQEIIFVDAAALQGEEILGYPVWRSIDENAAAYDCIVASGNNHERLKNARSLVDSGRKLVTLTARSAIVSRHARIGVGSFVGEFCYVGPGVTVGIAAILNTHAIVEHDCKVGNGCHIAVGATVAGGCRLEDLVMIGAGATLRDGISIVSKTVIGAGALVCKNITIPGTYVGVPARRIE